MKIVIVYFSGYGHTAKVAEAVAAGAKQGKAEVDVINVTQLDDAAWNKIDNADAIIFGSPTYMGSVSAKLKEFMELASGRWALRKWKNKIAAGFTNSGSLSGDKLNSIVQLIINAMQHGMIWVGVDQLSPTTKGEDTIGRDSINRLGGYSGLMTQSNNDTPEHNPPKADLDTAEMYGKRIADITQQFISGYTPLT